MSAPAGESQPLAPDVLLRDGSTLRLQAPVRADFGAIKELFDGLWEESHYLRFHGGGWSEIAARMAVQADGEDRVTLIGRCGGCVVAVAGFDGLREPRAAEVAVAVASDFQGRGVATSMLEQLVAIAADRGIHRFDADLISGGDAMLTAFEGAGFTVRRRSWTGELTVSLDITPSECSRAQTGEPGNLAVVASLRALLAPTSIAVAGAAATPGNIGRAVLENIIDGGFQGEATPVNRAGGVVCSRPAARNLDELPVAAELVIIAASGDEVLEFAAEAAAHGAGALLLLPASLEAGEEASVGWDEQLHEIVKGSGVRIVGPRSLGVINTAAEVSLNATFSGARVRPGALAIGAQAVAPGIGLLGHAQARQMGISVLVSIGGRADVSVSDLLEWCEADDRTAVLMLYVESFGDPERFTRVARRVSRRKPILVIKGRRSAERARSQARSRTAAALRGDAIIDAVLHRAGVLRFESSEELFHVAQLFESQPLPRGRRIGIVSNSNSVATLAADACATRRLEVTDPRGAPYAVLLGLGAGAPEYAARVQESLAEAGIDALIVCYVDRLEGDAEGVLAAISAVAAGQLKPIVASVVRSDGRLPASSGHDVPNYLFPETGVAVLARAAERRDWLSRPLGVRPHYPDVDGTAARALISSALDREPAGGWLSPREAFALLATHGIPVAASYRCRDLERALAVAGEIGGPVALRADLAAGEQADELDAALLGLEGDPALRSGWRELERRVQAAGRQWPGAILQRLVAPGADVLVGAFSDPDLGSVIALGVGGNQAGSSDTVAYRLPPATDVEADELIDSCAAVAAQLDRFRGAAALDREALRTLILRFGLLLGAVPEVAEADLNPVRCSTGGSLVLETRIRIEHRRPVKRQLSTEQQVTR